MNPLRCNVFRCGHRKIPWKHRDIEFDDVFSGKEKKNVDSCEGNAWLKGQSSRTFKLLSSFFNVIVQRIKFGSTGSFLSKIIDRILT